MSPIYEVYSLESAITGFFAKTTATRSECDAKAQQLAGGRAVPVQIQGSCSYTVYAGTNHESVVQFRPKSLALKPENSALARRIYGSLVPQLEFLGCLGTERREEGKESLLVYRTDRIRGTSYLDFRLAHDLRSPEASTWRMNAMQDVAR
jgi:hypothetical protein